MTQPQLRPQTLATAATQIESHAVLQQYGSALQIAPVQLGDTGVSQAAERRSPV
ncbi:MAG: hypothetical protein JKY37_28275, partial [Nannocystaceae bacterium]|nr:hypothetical protein [Nannocystaceae bacterium]